MPWDWRFVSTRVSCARTPVCRGWCCILTCNDRSMGTDPHKCGLAARIPPRAGTRGSYSCRMNRCARAQVARDTHWKLCSVTASMVLDEKPGQMGETPLDIQCDLVAPGMCLALHDTCVCIDCNLIVIVACRCARGASMRSTGCWGARSRT